MKAFYYAVWNLFLCLPDVVRILVEMLLATLCFYLVCLIAKYIYAVLVLICRGINYCILGSARYILPNIFRRNGYKCDEKIRRLGKANSLLLKKKFKKILRSKQNLLIHAKLTRIVLVLVSIWALLPFFPLEEYISRDTLTKMYGLNHFFVNAEKCLTPEIEEYPPFWIEEEQVSTVAETETKTESETGAESEDSVEETAQQSIYLKLNNATYYAHVRKAADIKSKSIYIVSRKDILLYEDIYEHDSKKYWLKVSLPDYGLEGWISEKVIDPEILASLDLQ